MKHSASEVLVVAKASALADFHGPQRPPIQHQQQQQEQERRPDYQAWVRQQQMQQQQM